MEHFRRRQIEITAARSGHQCEFEIAYDAVTLGETHVRPFNRPPQPIVEREQNGTVWARCSEIRGLVGCHVFRRWKNGLIMTPDYTEDRWADEPTNESSQGAASRKDAAKSDGLPSTLTATVRLSQIATCDAKSRYESFPLMFHPDAIVVGCSDCHRSFDSRLHRNEVRVPRERVEAARQIIQQTLAEAKLRGEPVGEVDLTEL